MCHENRYLKGVRLGTVGLCTEYSTGLWISIKLFHWIQICTTTPSFLVQVNGELAGYLQRKRELRQGCSLYPYLFVICMNALSSRMDKAVMDKCFGYHPLCKRFSLTHLCFADNLLVFVKGSKRSIEGVISVFDGVCKGIRFEY